MSLLLDLRLSALFPPLPICLSCCCPLSLSFILVSLCPLLLPIGEELLSLLAALHIAGLSPRSSKRDSSSSSSKPPAAAAAAENAEHDEPHAAPFVGCCLPFGFCYKMGSLLKDDIEGYRFPISLVARHAFALVGFVVILSVIVFSFLSLFHLFSLLLLSTPVLLLLMMRTMQQKHKPALLLFVAGCFPASCCCCSVG